MLLMIFKVGDRVCSVIDSELQHGSVHNISDDIVHIKWDCDRYIYSYLPSRWNLLTRMCS